MARAAVDIPTTFLTHLDRSWIKERQAGTERETADRKLAGRASLPYQIPDTRYHMDTISKFVILLGCWDQSIVHICLPRKGIEKEAARRFVSGESADGYLVLCLVSERNRHCGLWTTSVVNQLA